MRPRKSEPGPPIAVRPRRRGGDRLREPAPWFAVYVPRVRAADGNETNDATPDRRSVQAVPAREDLPRSIAVKELRPGWPVSPLVHPRERIVPFQEKTIRRYQSLLRAALSGAGGSMKSTLLLISMPALTFLATLAIPT